MITGIMHIHFTAAQCAVKTQFDNDHERAEMLVINLRGKR